MAAVIWPWALITLVLLCLVTASFYAAIEFVGNLVTMFRTTVEQHLGRELPEYAIESWTEAGLFVLPVLGLGALFCVVGLVLA